MEGLQIEYLPIDKIKPYAKNARKHQEQDLNAIKASIEEFGFLDALGVWGKDNTIVEGHGRYMAAKELGYNELPVVHLDWLTDEQRRAYALAHNKTAELSEWDQSLLDMELTSISDIDMTSLGFEITEQTEDEKEKEEQEQAKLVLADKFLVPPFSILDARQGYWQDRKRAWKKLIKDGGDRGNSQFLKSLNALAKKSGHDTYKEVNSLLDPVLSEVINIWFMPLNGRKAFDVFAGDTVFGYVTSYVGNEFTGIELREEQASFNQNRLKEDGLSGKYICDDGRNVLNHLGENTQDLFFSCPPYFDLETYSKKENDASNQKTYEDFYKILDEAFTNAGKCLKENRFAVVVCGDVRNKKGGGYYDFPGDIKRTFMRNGFLLYNELILVRTIGTKALTVNGSMANRKVGLIHEKVLCFYKGDKAKIKEEFGSDFLTERQNHVCHDTVLVFYKGDTSKIKPEFGECAFEPVFEQDREKVYIDELLGEE